MHLTRTQQVGWSGTTEFRDQWVFNEAAETYALDAEMAKKLADSNPEAFRNIVKRMLEANGRGYWETSDEVLDQLRDLYAQTEDEIEWSGGKGVRTSVVKPAAATAVESSSAAGAAAAAVPVATTSSAAPSLSTTTATSFSSSPSTKVPARTGRR